MIAKISFLIYSNGSFSGVNFEKINSEIRFNLEKFNISLESLINQKKVYFELKLKVGCYQFPSHPQSRPSTGNFFLD
jgi:hypothetical protein